MKYDPSDYISAKECAQRLQCSERHFKERIATQKGFPKPINRAWYWPDIHAFYAHQKKAG